MDGNEPKKGNYFLRRNLIYSPRYKPKENRKIDAEIEDTLHGFLWLIFEKTEHTEYSEF